MRTTVSIDDRLVERAKALSIERGVTLGEVIEEALRIAYLSEKRGAGRFTHCAGRDSKTLRAIEAERFRFTEGAMARWARGSPSSRSGVAANFPWNC